MTKQKKSKGVSNMGKLGDGYRKKLNNFTMKESKCYANTKLGKTTVIVYSSAFSWLLVTIILLLCCKKKELYSLATADLC